MSLVGRLEDLGLGEILQIVALSGKSGVLHVKSRGRTGRIYFFKGKVVRAFSDTHKVNLGELLVRKGYVGQDVIKKALTQQKQEGGGEKLGSILIRSFSIPKDKIEECVVELIEKAVFSLFYWLEGEFQFALTNDISEENVSVDFLQYDLAQNKGLNPQFLAMEGTRIMDEAKKGDEAWPPEEAVPPAAQAAEPPAPEAAPEPPKETTLLIVDDSLLFRNATKKLLEEKGYRVVSTDALTEAKRLLHDLLAKGENVVLVAGLVMPRTDNQGVLGCLELMDSLPSDKKVPVVVTCDFQIPDAEEALKKRNAMLLKKPRKTLLLKNKDNINAELDLFIKTLETSLNEFAVSVPKAEPDASATWYKEIKDEFQISSEGGAITTTPGLTLLKSMIAELGEAASGNEIILLILRLASEIMPRGVIFAVKGDKLNGLGQFGLENFIPAPLKVVRSLSLSLAGKMREVMESGISYRGESPDEELLETLFSKLGGERPTEIFLSPIYSGGKPVVLFYGDNLPSKKTIQDTDALEIFFTQAGQSMERLMLEKR